MLSRDDANRIAEQILHQAHATRQGGHTLAPRRVPILYRSPALDALPRSVQAELLQAARQAALRSWPFIVTTFLWLALIVGAWIGTVSHHKTVHLIAPFLVWSWLAPLLVRGLVARHRVRLLATQRLAQSIAAQ